MLNFTKLTIENFNDVAVFLQQNVAYVSDLTLGEKLIWCDYYNTSFAIFNDTLILREDYGNYKNAFHFPIGKDVDNAIKEIVDFSIINDKPLYFYCLNNKQIEYLNKIFPTIDLFYSRNDCDYIYLGENFKTFSGKSLHGQKNHLNHFKKEHKNYTVTEIIKEDIPKIIAFLQYFENNYCFTKTEKTENKKDLNIINNYFNYNFNGVILKENGKVLGFAILEINNDTLTVHIEKAEKNIVGSYQAMIEGYANIFINEKVKYINREDDTGDIGLRTSKEQYHPIELRKKYILIPRTAIFALNYDVIIKTERLIINNWTENDKSFYFNLVTNEQLNKYWGYNYKKDIDGEINIDSVFDIQKRDRENNLEYSFCIRYNNNPIGEFTIWNSDIFGGIEFGIRIDEKYQNKGFATECYKTAITYFKYNEKIRTIYCRCNKLNTPSKTMILKSGFNLYKEDTGYFYFKI